MGVLKGWKSATVYVNENVMRVTKALALHRGITLYTLIDEALREKIERDLTPELRKAFGYAKVKINGQRKSRSKSSSDDTGRVREAKGSRKKSTARHR